jgi:hypothetical protein
MEYSNPLGALANPTDFAGSPFLQAQQAYLKNDLAMPLIQAQQKMGLLSGLEKTQKMAEFMSPEQQQLRSAKAQHEMAGFAHDAAKRPLELDRMGLDNRNVDADIQKKGAELRKILAEQDAKPALQLYQIVGARANEIAKLPPAAQALAWDQMVQEAEATTGMRLPDKLRAFSPNALQNGKIAFAATQNSPDNLFRAGENQADRKTKIDVANISANASRYATDQANRRHEADAKRSPDQMLVDLGRELRQPNLPADRRQELESQYRALRRQKILGSKVVADHMMTLQFQRNPATGQPYTPQEKQREMENIINSMESMDTLLQPQGRGSPTQPNRSEGDILREYGIK